MRDGGIRGWGGLAQCNLENLIYESPRGGFKKSKVFDFGF